MKKIVKSKAFIAFTAGFFLYLITMLPELIRYGGMILNYSDHIFMFIPFTYHAYDAVWSGSLAWDWSSGLGADFLQSYAQMITTPFFLLDLLVPRDLLIYAMTFVTALKFAVGSLFAYFYIKRFVNNGHYAVIGGIIYMFSSFTAYNQIYNFNDAFAFFPLLLIAMEELCVNKRRGWFAVLVAYLMFFNTYLLFGEAVFCVIYYFIRCTDKSFGGSFKQFLSVAVEAVIGVCVPMFIVYPGLIFMTGYSRATEFMPVGEMFFYHDIFHYLKIIQSAFMIPDHFRFTSLFPEVESDYPLGTLQSSTAAFLPLFGASGVISWIWARKKSWQTKLMIIFPIMALVPVLNSLFSAMNAAFYTRWFYMPLLLAAMVSVKALEENISFKPGLIANGAMLALFFLYYLFLAPYGDHMAVGSTYEPTYIVDLNRVLSRYGIFIIFMMLIPAVSLLFVFGLKRSMRDQKFFPKLYAAAAVSVFFTFGMYSYFYLELSPAKDNIPIAAKHFSRNFEIDADLSDARIMTNGADGYGNMFIPTGLDNIQRCYSILDYGNTEYLEGAGYVVGRANQYFDYEDSCVPADLLSVKYIVTFTDPISTENRLTEEDTAKDGADDGPYTLNKYYSLGEPTRYNDFVNVQENLHYIPMGFTFDKMISKERLMEIENPYERELLMMKALVVKEPEKFADILPLISEEEINTPISVEEYDRLIDERRSGACSYVNKDTNGLEAQITLEKENVVFFSGSWNNGWRAFVDGNETECYNVQSGMLGVRVPAGTHSIKLEYRLQGMDVGTVISVIAVAALGAYLFIFRKKGQKQHEENTEQ